MKENIGNTFYNLMKNFPQYKRIRWAAVNNILTKLLIIFISHLVEHIRRVLIISVTKTCYQFRVHCILLETNQIGTCVC